jgi:hypothetical protein
MELTAEFAKYVVDHAEVDRQIPDGAYIYFEVAGEREFNAYSRELAERRRADGIPVALVRVRGIAPPQGSRLIGPVVVNGRRASRGSATRKRTV